MARGFVNVQQMFIFGELLLYHGLYQPFFWPPKKKSSQDLGYFPKVVIILGNIFLENAW